MKFSTIYDGNVEIFAESINRQITDQLGQSSCSVKLERPANNPLSEGVQLCVFVASETTQDSYQFYAGWLDTQSITMLPGGQTWEYNLSIKDLLEFEDNTPIEGYYRRAYFSDIARDLIRLSGANDPDILAESGVILFESRFIAKDITDPLQFSLVEIELGTDPRIITFTVEQGKPENLSSCLKRLCDDNGWTVQLERVNWLNIDALGQSGHGAIAQLMFRQIGGIDNSVPPRELIIDENVSLCSAIAFWEGPFSFTVEYATYSGAQIIGKGGDRVLSDRTGYTERPRRITIFPDQVNYSLPDLVAATKKTAKLKY